MASSVAASRVGFLCCLVAIVVVALLPADSVSEILSHSMAVSREDGSEVTKLRLVIIDVTFGFTVHFNFMSLIGVFIASQILRGTDPERSPICEKGPRSTGGAGRIGRLRGSISTRS